MKAMLLSKYRHLEIADLPTPVPGPGELLVRVAACGICGSDVHGYDGSSGRRIPPIVMGHEAAGRVAALGPEVTGWSEGDRVTFDSTISCGTCPYCSRGEINLCDRRQVLGVSCGDYRCAGAFAEYVIVPQRIAYKLPDALSFSEAAMLEAVAVAVHAVSLSQVSPGTQALVLGAGMIGLLTLQALRAAIAIIDKAGLAGLPVGAAVAVGPAVVGNLAESANLSVLGEVTNLASRLQTAAEAGEVMLAEDVYRRVKDWLDAQQIQAERVGLQLKGFDGPVFAYRVTAGTVAAATA